MPRGAKRKNSDSGPSKRSRSLSTGPSKFNVPVTNRFDLLKNSVDSTQIKPSKVSPIVVTAGSKIDSTKDLLERNKIDYYIKITSVGTKFFIPSKGNRDAVENHLRKNDIEFFTHPSADTKTLKIVLSGLPELSIDSINSCLKEDYNIVPVKNSMFKTKNSNKLYLLFFNPNEVTKANIMSIRYVCKHHVRWLPYKPAKRGPTQCLNCGMFGHGITHCHRKTSCLLCGELHKSDDCVYTKNNESMNQSIFKCVNCKSNGLSHNHRADDNNCPSKLKYLEIRNKINSKNRPIHSTRAANNRLPSIERPMTETQRKIISYADIMKQNLPAPLDVNSTHRSTLNFAHQPTNSQLWSFKEVTNLLVKYLNELANCKTKMDQICVIASLLQNVTD